MNEPTAVAPSAGGETRRDVCSGVALGAALALVAATFFLISPPTGETYPGAIPWRPGSWLHRVVEAMSLGGRLVSVRGVEIKDFALHLAAAAGLLVAAVSLARRRGGAAASPRGALRHAQVLLGLWVALSLLSSLWAGDADLARGQALLYAISVAWAVSLAVALPARLVRPLLHGIMVLSALAAALCVWYFHERNPYHRPGFPLGNPATLAAALLPGVLIALGTIGDALGRAGGRPRRGTNIAAVAAALSLVPLIWCLWLTYSRGALLGLGAGLVAFGVSVASARWRQVLAAPLGIAVVVGGAWWLSTSHLDTTMARGATMRFRLYAWRYAAELWNADSWTRVAGQGAAAYPRLAGAYAVRDRALDPAAFMGEIVEHAHNELFEVLAEIGLVGGVTWVGGMIATIAAAVAALRARAGRRPGEQAARGPQPADESPWPLRSLLAAVVAILGDAAFGSALRLPGVPAIFFTLLGTLWVACRNGTPAPADGPSAPAAAQSHSSARPPAAAAQLAAFVALAAAVGCGWLAARNWTGVQHEFAAQAAYNRENYDAALDEAAAARRRLLDPVRVMAARRLEVQCLFGAARPAVQAWYTATESRPAARAAAIARATRAYEAAGELRNRVPAFEYTDVYAARAAEWLAHLTAEVDPSTARTWMEQAERAWRWQRQRTPYDVETLLALTRYPAALPDHVALLRDALRFGDPYGPWRATLEQFAGVPGFDSVLGDFLAAAGPITPQTDVDAIVASMAPEAYRLAAAWYGLREDHERAAALAGRAVELYGPLRPRFPALQATALSEQADYVLRSAEGGPEPAVALLRQALASLPVIQRQQYDELARPLRIRLALCLLVGEHVDDGLVALESALGEAVAGPDEPAAFVQRLLRDAGAAGVPAELIARARRALCPRFPPFCEPTTRG